MEKIGGAVEGLLIGRFKVEEMFEWILRDKVNFVNDIYEGHTGQGSNKSPKCNSTRCEYIQTYISKGFSCFSPVSHL